MDCLSSCFPIFFPPPPIAEPEPEQNILYVVELPEQPSTIEPPERPATPGLSPSPSAPKNDSFLRPKKNDEK